MIAATPGCAVSLPDQGFGILAIRDVGVCANHAQRQALGIAADDHAAGQHPFPAAVLAQDAVFVRVSRGLAAEMGLAVALHLVDVVGVGAAVQRIGAVGNLVIGEAINLLAAARVKLHAGLHIPIPHAITGTLQCKFPAFFALGQGQLGQVAGRDVLNGALVVLQRTIHVTYGVGGFAYPE